MTLLSYPFTCAVQRKSAVIVKNVQNISIMIVLVASLLCKSVPECDTRYRLSGNKETFIGFRGFQFHRNFDFGDYEFHFHCAHQSFDCEKLL